jgi:hypothetical protein
MEMEKMPKLSKTRIINLNYNDGKRTIYNAVFDYQSGKNTLFSMENGVGKTVLIQIMIQPFIKSKRDLAGRSFEDYFTNNTPTYIMHEIMLDTTNDKLLIGMIIKKETRSDEEEKSRLRIIVFTHKYSKSSTFDIENIPFIEKENKVQRILKFSEAEQLIKEYSKGRLNFKVYNFNDNNKKNEYFNELDQYRINHKEWEDIIKKINNDESGLSNLFDKCKSDEDLIKSEILPAIESKLNSNMNQIENIKANLKEYIESYKRSRSSIDEVQCYDEFLNDCEAVIPKFKEGDSTLTKRESIANQLYSISIKADEYVDLKVQEKREFEDIVEVLKDELRRINHEELSYEYHKYKIEVNKLENEINSLGEKIENLKAHKRREEKNQSIQIAAEYFEELTKYKKNLSEVKERIANYEREDNEINTLIRNYKFTLKKLYGDKIEENKDRIEFAEKNLSDLKKNYDASSGEKKSLEKDLINIKSKISSCGNELKRFCDNIDKFKDCYKDFHLALNPFFQTFEENEIEKYRVDIQKSIIKGQNEKEDICSSIKELNNSVEVFEHARKLKEKENLEISYEIDNKRKDRKEFEDKTKEVQKILAIRGLSKDVVNNRAKAVEDIESDNIKLEFEKEGLQREKEENNKLLSKYGTGFVELPRDLEKEFQNKGIEFEHGLSYLRKYSGPFDEKKEILKSNPLIPYSLLLSKDDYKNLKRENIEVFSESPIPIIDKNKLKGSKEVEINNNILKLGDQEFFLTFNELLLDDGEREKLIVDIKNRISGIETEILSINDVIEKNIGYKNILKNYRYIGNEGIALYNCIEALEVKQKELTSDISKLEKRIKANKENVIKLQDKLSIAEENLKNLNLKADKFQDLLENYESYKKALDEKNKLVKLEEETNKKYDQLVSIIDSLQGDLNKLKLEIRELISRGNVVSNNYSLYKDAETGEPVSGDLEEIEGRLKACESKYKDDQKRDKEDEKRYLEEVDKYNSKLNEIKNDSGLHDEYENIKHDKEKLREIKNSLQKISKDISDNEAEFNKLSNNQAKVIGMKDEKENQIVTNGFERILATEEIADSNFKQRKQKTHKDLHEQKEIVEVYEKTINNLGIIQQKLSIYKSVNLEAIDININFDEYEKAEMEINSLVSEEKQLNEEYKGIEKFITKITANIFEKYRDRNTLIKDRLQDFLGEDSKIGAKNKFESLVEVITRKRDVLKIELQNIKNEEETVLDQIIRYCKNINDELKTIDSKSYIKFKDKNKKMLIIEIPEELDDQGLKDFIRETVNETSSIEGNYDDYLDDEIRTSKLYGKLIGSLSRIKVYIYKIETSGLVKKSWREAISKNSGGEKFVSMFILLASLLSYMRKKPSDIGTFEESKIIIMDNPFAKTNAEHLLEPMFEIARKYGIQLICFSGIGGSAVYNRFEVIYVAKVISDRFRNSERVEFLNNSEDTLEMYDIHFSTEQVSLF